MRLVNFLADYLNEVGVDTVFMLSGTGSVYIDDAFAIQKGMRYVCARHEAAATIMAMAAAKLTNKIGVVIATTGPGGTNAIGGVVEAWVDSAPVLVISGQVDSDQVSPNVRSFGVQGFNVIENVANFTKYAVQVTDPRLIKMHLQKAIHLATSGRPGPVWLDIPMDIQSAEIDVEKLVNYQPTDADTKNVDFDVSGVMASLYKAKRPLVVFGQGIRQASATQKLIKFLDKFYVPSISARMGIDILPHKYQKFFGLGGVRGTIGAAQIMKRADFVLGIGTSFTHAFAGRNYDYFSKNTKISLVNLDVTELFKKGLMLDHPINADVADFLDECLKLNSSNADANSRLKWLQECKKHIDDNEIVTDEMRSNPINSYYFVDCLSRCMIKDQILVNDAGSANYVCSQAFKLKDEQRELTSGAFYSMGLALPLAIGASASQPGKQVIAVTGDGSIELNIQELRTMSQNRLNIKLFVINNGGYASIRKSQDEMAGGRYTDDVEVLNFQNIANAFEVGYRLIDDHATMKNQISSTLSSDQPCLIEVICDPNQAVLNPFQIKVT